MKYDIDSRIYYYGTQEPVRLGDHVELIRWFGLQTIVGYVSYIPGISKRIRDIESNDVKQWGVTADDGTMYLMAYYPTEVQPSTRIRLISRQDDVEKVHTGELTVNPKISGQSSSRLFYHGTSEPVRLGDFIDIGWCYGLFKSRGCVSYIPGLSKFDFDMENDHVQKWAYTLESGHSKDLYLRSR